MLEGKGSQTSGTSTPKAVHKAPTPNSANPAQKPKAAAKPSPVPSRSREVEDTAIDEPDAEASGDGSGSENDVSEAAKRQRLRRLCERKSSGKLNVPEHIHQMWLKGGHNRDELLELLEESDWQKDLDFPLNILKALVHGSMHQNLFQYFCTSLCYTT